MGGIAGPSSHNTSSAHLSSARQRMRSASSASVSSTSSNPSHALSRATRAIHNGNLAPISPADDNEGSEEYVLAMHDYEPQQPNATCLTFKHGQIIRVINRDPSGWWDGEVDSRRGWFPSNYVTSEVGLLTDEELPMLLVSSFCRVSSTANNTRIIES